MSDDYRISTHSVARNAMLTDPIVLRETADRTRRLVFAPMLVGRPDDPLRGVFVYQRKLAGDTWRDIGGIPLSSLKAGEGFRLELHGAEVSQLVSGLLDRKSLYEQHGIEWGTQDFVRTAALPQIVRTIVESPDSELAHVLAELDRDDVLALGRKLDRSKLDLLLDEWRRDPGNPKEEHWQDLLTRNSWVFSQLTGSPVVLVDEKAYVGGKDLTNIGGGHVDYLIENELTHNISFIEIKTPATPICAGMYRTSGAMTLDKEFTGGINQVLGYRETFEKEYFPLTRGRSQRSYNPRCYLLAGSAASLTEEEARSFELFRNALTGVQVLAFDEVERRLQGLKDALAV